MEKIYEKISSEIITEITRPFDILFFTSTITEYQNKQHDSEIFI